MTAESLSPNLDGLGRDLHAAAARRIERRMHGLHVISLVGVILATLIMAAGAALAAAQLFGKPAPKAVKQAIAHVDAGLPADLRLNPEVASARSVAGIRHATLYFARLKDGGYCTELVLQGAGRGAICTTGPALASPPIEVTLPYADPGQIEDSFVVYGRVNRPAAASFLVQYGDGSNQAVSLGERRFFVFRVPQAKLIAARTGMRLVALTKSGSVVAHYDLTKILTEGPAKPAAIELSTHTVHGNLARISGFNGRVTVPRATSLKLFYPEGGSVPIPLSSSGRFGFRFPTSRFDDFTSPGRLIARDAQGKVVAQVWVAAPSYWIGRERS